MSNLQVEASQSTNNIPITLTPKQQPTLLLTPDKVWGTKDYENLENKPSLNGRELTKGMTLADFNLHPDKVEKNEEDIININEYLKELTPKNTAEGETSLYIKDALELPVFEMSIEGNSYQQQTTGKQLYNYKDTTTVSYGITVDSEGWITATYDNTNGTESKYLNYWTNNLNLKSSTNYLVVLEVKNIQGTGILEPVSTNFTNPQTQGQFNSQFYADFQNLQSNKTYTRIMTTVEDPQNVSLGLRTYIAFKASQSGAVTFRLSVLEDTSVTPETFVYEKYTGEIPSPNPDYPQDVEVIEPYNLFDKDNMNIINGVPNGTIVASTVAKTFYIEIEPNHTYTVSREVIGSRFTISTTKDIPTIGSTLLDNIVNNNASYITITTSSEAKYLLVYYLYNNTEDEEKILDSIQIVKGTTPKPYTQFGSIQTKIIRKNHLDTSKFVGKTSNGMTASINDDKSIKFVGTTTALSNFWISNVYDVLKAGTYKFITNIDLTGKGRYTLIDAASGTSSLISNQTKTYTFTITNDMILTTILIQINADVTLDDDFYIMLVKEGDSEEYEPYQENNLDINLKGNFIAKIGDVADTLRIENGRTILTKRIGKVVYNGSETWNRSINLDNKTYRFSIRLANYKQGSGYEYQTPTFIVDKFIPCGFNYIYEGKRSGVSWWWDNSTGANSLIISFLDNRSLEDFKVWLQANSLTVYYILVEPYEIDLGEIDMPKTFKNISNAQVITNINPSGINLTYALDLKKYYDNKIAELSSQLL